MNYKKEKVALTYEALYFKLFMDSESIYLYNKKIYLSHKFAGSTTIFLQMLGNIGATSSIDELDKDLDVVIFSDRVIEDFKNGIKDNLIQEVEDLINKNNTPHRKLKFMAESMLLDFLKTRAKANIRLRDDDDCDGEQSGRDDIMLSLLLSYKESAQNKVQTLFE